MSEQFRQAVADEPERFDPDPCTCRRDQEPWVKCRHCQYEHDVDMAGGHLALMRERERQQNVDAGMPSWLC